MVGIQGFYFSKTGHHTKVKQPTLPYYLLKTWGRVFRYLPFPKVFVLWEMWTGMSRNWTWVVASISYDDNHCTTGTSIRIYAHTYALAPTLLCIMTPKYVHLVTKELILPHLDFEQHRKLRKKRPKVRKGHLVGNIFSLTGRLLCLTAYQPSWVF